MDYYFPDFGAFAFMKECSNIGYYGFSITKGKKKLDLQGTFLFMWGLFFVLHIGDK